MNILLEVIPVPVSDTDKSKDFYANKLGFNVDMDIKVSDSVRFVQLTPPGSACSIHIGEGTSKMEPGSLKGPILVVDNIEEARKELEAKGVALGETEEMSWGKHISLSDPDGNAWTLQESYARNKRQTS